MQEAREGKLEAVTLGDLRAEIDVNNLGRSRKPPALACRGWGTASRQGTVACAGPFLAATRGSGTPFRAPCFAPLTALRFMLCQSVPENNKNGVN